MIIYTSSRFVNCSCMYFTVKIISDTHNSYVIFTMPSSFSSKYYVSFFKSRDALKILLHQQ